MSKYYLPIMKWQREKHPYWYGNLARKNGFFNFIGTEGFLFYGNLNI